MTENEYMVIVRSEGETSAVMDAYGPVAAINPGAAVERADGHLTGALDDDKTIEVYGLAVGPDGDVEPTVVDAEVLAA